MQNNYVINILKINECKICLEHVDVYNKYCNCSGSIKYIHKNCLIKYIEQNENKIESINYYRKKIKCTVCNSYIYFHYKKKSKLYILLLFSILLYIFFTIIYFILCNHHLFKLILIIIYLIITNIYISLVYYYLKYKKLYKSYIGF